ncbi:transcriptional regulator [Clostridium sp. P21]|uniref:Transcriptional regulator n=1 Tax=Clostridium muellerianum TaxID=2716538 RepID=A0A7Y0ELS1_9CLOT|nr:type IV toxin-antitoxin system AbiEi family antitoxin domain-containing protein [Clostridium muellerianum]NMM65818.1 transcriptional regulator [Clostridium muellerianum]
MDYSKMLRQLIRENGGIVSTKMASEHGIPRIYLSDFVKKGILQRFERGIYISTNSIDDMYCFQMRFDQSIFSHESALYLHQYLKDPPEQKNVTVKTGMNTKSLIRSGAKVYSIKMELYLLGTTEIITNYGRIVRSYDIERSICDIIRSRSKVNNEIIVKSLKIYNDSPEKDLSKLMEYAKKLNVLRILNGYLEFL